MAAEQVNQKFFANSFDMFSRVFNCQDHVISTKCQMSNSVSNFEYLLLLYRRSLHFVIFGTKKVSRNSGITNFETLFSAKSQIGAKNFLKSTFLANFSFFESQNKVFFDIFLSSWKES